MKKLHSLFILLILALTMFVGCQMPTDGTGNGVEAVDSKPTVDADETTYGFVKTVDYTVVANGQSLPGTKTGAELIAIAKEKNLVKDTDYTINGTTVTLTEDGAKRFFGNTSGGNTSSGGDTSTYTVSVPSENYTTSSGSSYGLAIQNAPIDGYKKDDTVEILITNGNFDVNTGYGTPEGLYLINVKIEDKSNGNDIKSTVDLKIEDNKIKFTMPDKNISVFASFEDVVCRAVDVEAGDSDHFPNWFDVTTSNVDTDFQVALRFDTKEYDNLEEFDDDIYKFELCNLRDIYKNPEDYKSGSNYLYFFYIQLGKDYNVYDYTTKKGKYHENPVVIYNGTTMCEPEIDDVLGNRWVDLDSQN